MHSGPAGSLLVRIDRPATGVVRAVCSGRVVAESAPLLREELITALRSFTPDSLEIDLADVSDLDATGLGILLGAYLRGEAIDCRVSITRTSGPVADVIGTTGIPAHNDAPAHAPGGVPAWPVNTDRAPLGELPVRLTLAYAERDLDRAYQSIVNGARDQVMVAARRSLDLAGVLSLTDSAVESPDLVAAIAQAAHLFTAYVLAATGWEQAVQFGYVADWSRHGAILPGDMSLPLTIDIWLRTVELCLVVGDRESLLEGGILHAREWLQAPDPADPVAVRAMLYARALAAWIERPDADNDLLRKALAAGRAAAAPVPGDEGEFIAELNMISAAVAADPRAFNAALAESLTRHRNTVVSRELASTKEVRAYPGGQRLTSTTDLIAYRPLAVVAAAVGHDRNWPVTITSDYVPRALIDGRVT
jgi:anti-anti-sigma regulatory factor